MFLTWAWRLRRRLNSEVGGGVRSIVMNAFVAVATLAAASSAHAEARLWDGTVVVTGSSPLCQPYGDVNGSLRAFYRPHLKASDPKAAVILQTDNLSHIIVIRAITNTPTLNGSGDYCGIDFDPAAGESSTWFGGRYNIDVLPAVVTMATPEVRVTGMVTKFGNIPGCNLRFRGVFVRRPG